jgi:hypothetical protein
MNDYSKFVAGKDVVRVPGLPGATANSRKTRKTEEKTADLTPS